MTGTQRWSAQERSGDEVSLEYNARVQHIGVSAPASEPVYFIAPGPSVITSLFTRSCGYLILSVRYTPFTR